MRLVEVGGAITTLSATKVPISSYRFARHASLMRPMMFAIASESLTFVNPLVPGAVVSRRLRVLAQDSEKSTAP
jgi:acyl dehydratase